jgi:hypothetical protein
MPFTPSDSRLEELFDSYMGYQTEIPLINAHNVTELLPYMVFALRRSLENEQVLREDMDTLTRHITALTHQINSMGQAPPPLRKKESRIPEQK